MKLWAAAGILAVVAFGQQPFEVLSAVYSAGGKTIDVTSTVRSLVRDNALVFRLDPKAFGLPEGGGELKLRYKLAGQQTETTVRDSDEVRLPGSAAGSAPASRSGFSISELFSSDSKSASATAPVPAIGGSTASTPAVSSSPAGPRPTSPPSVPRAGAKIAPIGAEGGLRIFYARFGTPDRMLDVRERLRGRLNGDRLDVRVSASDLGAQSGGGQVLEVVYEFRGRTFTKVAREGETLSLP
jgi:hypothetical protein